MFGRLLSREGRFFDLFRAHAEQCVRAAQALKSLVDGEGSREEHTQVVNEAEHAADRITADTMKLIHTTYFTPLDRNQIHRLVNAMDDVCDLVQDAAETVTLYDIAELTPEAARLVDIAAKCVERVRDLVGQLGVAGSTFETIAKTCEEIDRLESDADRVMRAAVSRLFREEQDVRELIKMKAIYELLEAITDRCLDVANVAQGMALESS